MSDVQTWDPAAANNNSAAPDGWPEGMPYSSVNNAARENMAAIARLYADINGSLTTGGTGSAYTLTSNRTITAYEDGLTFIFKASADSIAAGTLNLNAIGAAAIKETNGLALQAGTMKTNNVYMATYNGSTWWLHAMTTPLADNAGIIPGSVNMRYDSGTKTLYIRNDGTAA